MSSSIVPPVVREGRPVSPTSPDATQVADRVTWIGALDPVLRNFDVILKTANGTSYNAYAVRGSTGVAITDTVKQEFTEVFLSHLEQGAGYAAYAGAAESPDVRVSLFDLQGGEVAPFIDLIAEADGLVFGTPTINGDAARTVWNLLSCLVDIETKGKLGAAFGPYDWTGEAVRMVEARLQGLKMRASEEGLRIKHHPTEDELEDCRDFGRGPAVHPTGRNAPQEIDMSQLLAP